MIKACNTEKAAALPLLLPRVLRRYTEHVWLVKCCALAHNAEIHGEDGNRLRAKTSRPALDSVIRGVQSSHSAVESQNRALPSISPGCPTNTSIRRQVTEFCEYRVFGVVIPLSPPPFVCAVSCVRVAYFKGCRFRVLVTSKSACEHCK